jgi:hypothetical protein
MAEYSLDVRALLTSIGITIPADGGMLDLAEVEAAMSRAGMTRKQRQEFKGALASAKLLKFRIKPRRPRTEEQILPYILGLHR